jgi:Tol biopolymer transport system component
MTQQVGPYEVVSLLGKGGMGEVYRARDSRLGRDVALKVLPIALSSDGERLRRFEQEARTAGRLNHPNVLTVFDVGVHENAPYIVTELLQGEELRAHIMRGPIPQPRAIDFARQIASGLAEAHANGVVHRDLKPENVFVTADGRAKILDFGLAKLKEPPAGSHIETAASLTGPGVVMGTAGYMAPEQVRGRDADERADIFSLGVVLHEMLSGMRPFSGESAVETMSAILTVDPPELNQIDPRISPVLARIVGRCLNKRPEQRFQSASDLAFALDALMSAPQPPGTLAVATAPAAPRRRGGRLAVIAGLAAVGIGGLTAAWSLNRSDYWWRNPLAEGQFTPLTDFPEAEVDAVISHDGKFVAFLSDRDGPFDVWAGQIGTGEFHNLTKGRTRDMMNPRVRNLTFSPDGSQVVTEVRVSGRAVSWSVPTMGGSVRPFADGVELTWSPDGTRLAYHTDGPGDPIFVGARDDKVGKQIHAGPRGVHCHYLSWSPDGAFIYFVQGFPPDEMDVWRVPARGGQPERLTFHNARVAYPTVLDDRTLLYIAVADDGTGPWLNGMDLGRRVPHRISFGVERYTSIAASGNGRRLVATVANPDASLWRVPVLDRPVEDAGATRIALPSVRALAPRIGPGFMLYLSSKGGDDGIWRSTQGSAIELWSGSLGRLIGGPAVSPDGRRIAFTAQKSGQNSLYLMNSNGTSLVELGDSLNVRGAPAWPSVGEWLTVAAGPERSGRGPFQGACRRCGPGAVRGRAGRQPGVVSGWALSGLFGRGGRDDIPVEGGDCGRHTLHHSRDYVVARREPLCVRARPRGAGRPRR